MVALSKLSSLIRNKSWGFGRYFSVNQSAPGSYLVSSVYAVIPAVWKPDREKAMLKTAVNTRECWGGANLLHKWWGPDEYFNGPCFLSCLFCTSAPSKHVCQRMVISIWTLKEVWNCRKDSLVFVFFPFYDSFLLCHLCELPNCRYMDGCRELSSWLANQPTVSLLSNCWTAWQTKTGQFLNGFKCFCFVVDAKCGGGKKTLCVL